MDEAQLDLTPPEPQGGPAQGPEPEGARGTRKRAAKPVDGLPALEALEALEALPVGRSRRAGQGTKSGLWAFSKALMERAAQDKEVFSVVFSTYMELLRVENPLKGTGYPVPAGCPSGLENYLTLLRAVAGAQRNDAAVTAAVRKLLAATKPKK